MKFLPYPRYKDSGIDWLGEIPEHWEPLRLSWLFRRSKTTNRSDAELLSIYRDYGVIPKSSRDDNFNKPSDDLSTYQLVEVGDLVLNKMKTWQGSIAISEFEGIVSPAYFVAKPQREFNLRFVHYLLRSPVYISQYLRYSKGIRPNQWDLDFDDFRVIAAILPPIEEQKAIAEFLDVETLKIDELIDKQERLTTLLQEKRQALISHAVTKGLNHTVPMKDSGIKWLGEIPVHWEVKRLKHVLSWIEQGWSPDCEARLAGENEWGVLKTGCVNRGVFNEYEHKTLPANIEPAREYEVNVGDVLMSRASGSPDLVGSAAYVYECRKQLLLSDKTFRLHRRENLIDGQYLSTVLNSTNIRTQIKQSISGAEGLANNITQGTIKNLVFALPSLEEQSAILASIKCKFTELDSLIEKADGATELLREHRTALISAAVTGKIDVRQNRNGYLPNY
ncbi:MAG TPA: hypothetical protein VN256_06415 [Pyrinomonadaceae bacterium]|nr:hypothetical protein [Pyrinomonadaceae bacterium]